MFYLIIGILILLFYLFAAPSSIKGTFNIVALVLLLVVLIILLALTLLKVLELPSEYVVVGLMTFLAYYALRDLNRMPRKKSPQNRS